MPESGLSAVCVEGERSNLFLEGSEDPDSHEVILEAGAAVRDTRHRELGALAFPTGEWQAFLGTAKR